MIIIELRDVKTLRTFLQKSCSSLLALAGLLFCIVPGVQAQTASACVQWRYDTTEVWPGASIWRSSAQEIADTYASLIHLPQAVFPTGNGSWYQTAVAVLQSSGFPNYQIHLIGVRRDNCPSACVESVADQHVGGILPTQGCQVYVSAPPTASAQCGSSCNGVGHPINPASAAVYDTETDSKESDSIVFRRFYDSADSGGADVSVGWRHSFGRSVQPKYLGSAYKAYVSGPDNSSLHDTEALACTSGFLEIKSRVSAWANANASYSNGICALSVGSAGIGTLQFYYDAPSTPVSGVSTIVGFDATRDDGQVVSFTFQGGVISAPPGIAMRLQQTGGGYILTDTDDNVESYDANGRLLSIMNRAGIVQTMGYNSSGRLSGVTDSFGHSLALSYDAQGRLTRVTRQ